MSIDSSSTGEGISDESWEDPEELEGAIAEGDCSVEVGDRLEGREVEEGRDDRESCSGILEVFVGVAIDEPKEAVGDAVVSIVDAADCVGSPVEVGERG